MTEQQRHLRRQFVTRVLRPIGLGLLQAYEQTTVDAVLNVEWRTFASFFGQGDSAVDGELDVQPKILDYLLAPILAQGISDFQLSSVKIAVDFEIIAGSARTVLAAVFDNLSEALHCFDPDVVLLSGRPSRLPVVADMLVERLGIAPDRLVLMHQYSPGSWYPVSEATRGGRIGDPKTTAAVGGMLCALSERELTNFTLFTHNLQMRSTANFIGELGTDMRLTEDRVIFNADDLKTNDPEARRKKFKFMTKMRIGSRQLPFERWTANPLYQVRLELPNRNYRIQTPITVSVERDLERPDAKFELPDEVLKAEARKEELTFSFASGANHEQIEVNQEPPPNAHSIDWASIQLEFRTLADEEGYWLDTGILAFP